MAGHIIITGYPTFENVVAALQENVVEFLVKPIVFSDLLNAIRKAEKIINAIGSV